MANSVAIIGSFQKYYNDILDLIKLFKNTGLHVLSPKESYINRRIDDFVIFKSDNQEYSPEEIQMITLNKIISADCVYVYNPNGYVGKTTCYEIGFCFAKKKPVFFFDNPIDLPIPVLKQKQVIKPQEFANFVFDHEIRFIDDYSLCPEAENAFDLLFDTDKESKQSKSQRIVICGSMMFYEKMLECQRVLGDMGIDAIVPKEEDEIIKLYNEKQFSDFKKRVSRAYLGKIRDKNTIGVLIYNAEKRGIKNYIGPNTLVEVAMAFTWNRKIFLYNDIYLPLSDELNAWNCISLKGDMRIIKNELFNEKAVIESPKNIQLSLFDAV
jgi:nucleoside 2-deoxyribosyltransferase